MTKSEVAFRLSAELLFSQNRKVYFWTFTLRRVWPDWFYARAWNEFSMRLANLYGHSIKGLKVIELHASHGIHFHALVNQRVWVGEVRRIGARFGFGRVHVQRADPGAIEYVSKYLGKEFRTRRFFSGCSRWGTIGGFDGVRVRDLECDSNGHRCLRVVQEELERTKLPLVLVATVFRSGLHPERNHRQLRSAARAWLLTGDLSGFSQARSLDPIWVPSRPEKWSERPVVCEKPSPAEIAAAAERASEIRRFKLLHL